MCIASQRAARHSTACAHGANPSRLLCMCCRHPLLVTSPTAGVPPCTHSPHRYTNRCSPIDPTPPHIQPAPSACMQVRYGVEDRDPPHDSTPPQRISTLHTPHACRGGTAHSSTSNTPHACRRGTVWRTGIPPACQRRWSALWRSDSPRRQQRPAPAATACTMAPAWAGCTDPSGRRRCGGRGVGFGGGENALLAWAWGCHRQLLSAENYLPLSYALLHIMDVVDRSTCLHCLGSLLGICSHCFIRLF